MLEEFKKELKEIRINRLKEDISLIETQINSNFFENEESLKKIYRKKDILEKELKELKNEE
jgi:hypothetical protein